MAVHPSAGIDLRQFGASGSGRTTTAITTSGSPNVALSTALDFSNGQGIVIGGAGAAYALNQPTGFAAASYCTAKTSTGNITSGTKVITGVTNGGGFNSGNNVTGTGIPASTTVVNYNPATQTVRISNNATATQTTTLTVSDPCNATYFYRIAAFDSNGGIGVPLTAVSTSGPVIRSTWDVNCLTWVRPTGTVPAGYIIWYSVDGGATYNFLQTANTEGSGSCTVGTNGPVWDGGQPPSTRPWWIPNNPATIPIGGQPDWLRTTITSGGGTNALTLAVNAGQTIGSPTDPVIGLTLHDDTNAWTAWYAALNLMGGTGVVPALQPPGVNLQSVYRVNSGGYITKDGVRIRQEPGSVIQPYGATFNATTGVYAAYGGSGLTLGFSLADNVPEATSCAPLTSIAGLSLGQNLIFQQPGPGGTSQSVYYSFVSKIVGLGCEGKANSIRLADPAPITLTDAVHTQSATISGTLAAGDTVQVAITGEITCTGTYTIIGSDNSTTAARGLAKALSASCPVVATNTLNVVNIAVPSAYTTFNFAGSSGHGGGGTEAVTMSAGTAASVQSLTPLRDFTLENPVVDGTDQVSTILGGLWGEVAINYTDNARVSNATLSNANGGGTAFYSSYSYGADFRDVNIQRGSSGTPNITSASTFWMAANSKTRITNIKDVDALSFGSQLTATSYDQLNNVASDNTWWGRGWKFAGVLRAQVHNLQASGGVFKNIAICCGSYRNTFDTIDSSYSYGTNPTGIGFFDAWSRYNLFSKVRSTGNVTDWDSGQTDTNNTVFGFDTGAASGFPTVLVQDNSSLFYGANGCELAFNSTAAFGATPAITCQRTSGTWTPRLTGSTTTGTTTYVNQWGYWERNDRMVTARFFVQTSAALSGFVGNTQISTLPFPLSPVITGGNGSCSIQTYSGVTFFSASYTQLMAGISTGSDIVLQQGGSNVSGTGVAVGSIGNPFQVIGTCTYPVQ